LSRFAAKGTPVTEALSSVVQSVGTFLHADSCLLYLTAGQELVLSAAYGPSPGAVGNVRLALEEGLTGWVARERRLLAISREAYRDSRFKLFRDLPEDTFEAFLSAPVIALNRVVGVINVQHRDPHTHSGDELEMLTAIGEQAGSLVGLACVDFQEFERTSYADYVLALRVGAGNG
jgi:uroporphyrinogen-III synthase